VAYNYPKTSATADRLLKNFGKPATITRTAPGAYNPATGGTGAPVVASQTPQVVVIDYPHSYIDGTLIRQGDRQAFISPLATFSPQAGDVLTWGGVEMTLISVKPVAPAGVPVLFEAQVRA
jgi:hypothetical protein